MPSQLSRTTTEIASKCMTLNHQWSPDDSPWLDAATTFYWNQTRYDEQRIERGQYDQTEFDTLGFSLVNHSTIASNVLSYGVDGYRDTVKTVRDDEGQQGQRPDDIDGEAKTWGAFLQAKVPAGEKLAIEPALRYDHFSNQSNNLAASSSDSALSASLGASWQTTSWLTLNARYDEAFRAPSVEEMYSSGSHYCIPAIPNFLPNGLCNTFVANPDLQAEEAANKGVKADLRFANLAGDDNEALTLRQAVAEIAHRLLVADALEIELRIGGELEGAPAEAVELFVHEVLHSPQKL